MSKNTKALQKALAASKKQPTKIELRMRAAGYMTVEDVVQATGVHEVTVYRWIGDNEVASLKSNGRRWITRSSLIEKVGPEVARLMGITKSAG